MQFTFAKCLAASIAALVLPSVAAQTNTSQEFFLRTEVIDGNPKFANLYRMAHPPEPPPPPPPPPNPYIC